MGRMTDLDRYGLAMVLFLALLVLLVCCLPGCAGEQLSTVQGDFAPLWHDDPTAPAALQAPPK
jgi:hypothetical protein